MRNAWLMQNMQSKLSREAFLGQRRVIFFGEEFAKRGLIKGIHSNNRESEVSIWTDVFVVKGGTAKEALNPSTPLEKPPGIASLKKHEQFSVDNPHSPLPFYKSMQII